MKQTAASAPDGIAAAAATASPPTSKQHVGPRFVDDMYAAFDAALAASANQLREVACTFARRPVRMRIIGAGLADRTTRAFAHLEGAAQDEAAPIFYVDLWDETETGVPCPREDLLSGWREWIACGGVLSASEDARFVAFRYADSVTVLDRKEQRMIGCRRDGSHLSGGEYSKPLLLMLSIWHHDRGVQLLHAGLLARNGMGVLLPGESGTGKSTTCLAGVSQGLEFLGDDFVGVARGDDNFIGYSLFNTSCLAANNLTRFPTLEALAVVSGSPQEEKPILFLSEVFPQRVRASVPVRAVLLLRIRQERTEVRPARRAEAMRAFAASTLHTVVPRPGREALQMISELVERVPAFWLLLGPDINDVAPSIDRILSAACQSDAR